MKTERSKLHKDLMKIKRKGKYYVNDILDFIIEDRKRAVEPLVKCETHILRFQTHELGANQRRKEAIGQTLKNAGLED